MNKSKTVAIVLIISIFIIILTFINQKTPPTPYSIPTNNLSTFTSASNNIQLEYPNILTVEEKGAIVTLSHSIPYKNYGGCDMSGLAPQLDDLTDFKISFEIKPANYFPYDQSEGQASFGNLTGQVYTNGIEGCGEREYYFPVGQNTLVVKKTLIQALENSSQAEEILKLPNVISSEKSNKILTQILSTVKFKL